MNNIIFTIGLVFCMLSIWKYICAYKKGEYNPIIAFWFRQGYEWEPIVIIADLGLLLPLLYFSAYVKPNTYAFVYSLCILCIYFIPITILNIKYYIKTKWKRVLIETILTDLLLFGITIVALYKVVFL